MTLAILSHLFKLIYYNMLACIDKVVPTCYQRVSIGMHKTWYNAVRSLKIAPEGRSFQTQSVTWEKKLYNTYVVGLSPQEKFFSADIINYI